MGCKMTNKIRIIIEVVAIVLLVVLAATFIIMAQTPSHKFAETTYVVKSGDSLWYISGLYCPDGMDKWDYIHMVQNVNGMTSCTIYPGQCLTVFEVFE